MTKSTNAQLTFADCLPPCDHHSAQVGLVRASTTEDPPPSGCHFMAVATCVRCYIRTVGYVQMRSGLIPSEGLEIYRRLANFSADTLAELDAVTGKARA